MSAIDFVLVCLWMGLGVAIDVMLATIARFQSFKTTKEVRIWCGFTFVSAANGVSHKQSRAIEQVAQVAQIEKVKSQDIAQGVQSQDIAQGVQSQDIAQVSLRT